MSANLDTLRDLYKAQLKQFKIQERWINRPKNSQNKKVVISRLLNYLAAENTTKEQSIKLIRQLGIKSSNEELRSRYDEILPPKKLESKVTRLRSDYRPKHNKIPDMKFSKPKNAYFYAAVVYYKCEDTSKKKAKKRKQRLVPKDAFMIETHRQYNNRQEFGFWNTEILSKREVIETFMFILAGIGDEESLAEGFENSSNWKGVTDGACNLVAFKYDRLLKSF